MTIIFYKMHGGGRMCGERNRLKNTGVQKKKVRGWGQGWCWAFIKSMCTMYKLDKLTLQASNSCVFESFHYLLHGHSSNAKHQCFQPERI